MNAVEIEEAISNLFEQPFDATEFPFQFLEAFGNKTTTLKRLRTGESNKTDLSNAVLQHNNIHVAISPKDHVKEKMDELRLSPSTKKQKVKFILATDGFTLEAEALNSDIAPIACDYVDLPDHFGYFLTLAGITAVDQIKENSFDIRATSRLNKLYVELLKNNPEWSTEKKRQEMNHFMARLVFCFFAEDTDIFSKLNLMGNHQASDKTRLFSDTVNQMSERDGSNTSDVIQQIFKTMDIKIDNRAEKKVPRWAMDFPYVNGELFSGSTEVPKFTKIARSFLINIGNLDWTQVNPDIFGSMIQAVADDEERGDLGMHYTSVPNILKVLNPLFLDDLREQLVKAEQSPVKLINLRKRMSTIRVFDPACGSGNFLVIAYKEMRGIEAEINESRGEKDKRSEIPLTNFRGIEIKHFSAEIARLALVIAEYQADVLYRGQLEALTEFLPLGKENWITCGNALTTDWEDTCPPMSKTVKLTADDLFKTPLKQTEINTSIESFETYICGNPPFKGARKQEDSEKKDLERIFSRLSTKWGNVDYVGAWLIKAALFNDHQKAPFAFVSTNSLCQGQQIPITWSILEKKGFKIRFAHTSFTWSNLAANKAGVTVVVTGVDNLTGGHRWLYSNQEKRLVSNINPYLTEHDVSIIEAQRIPLSTDIKMELGVYYSKSAGLILDTSEKNRLLEIGIPLKYIRRFIGSSEFIKGQERFCLWISDDELSDAIKYGTIKDRIESVKNDRSASKDKLVNKMSRKSHLFRERKGDEESKVFIPIVSSENRDYFPVGFVDSSVIPTNKAFYIPNAPSWVISILSSKLHLTWIETVCGKLRTDYSYSSTLGWNTFPMPKLTDKNIHDLTKSAEDILMARESHFPATIAELYKVTSMPENLKYAHLRNDEIIERIYIGRRFNSDTERLDKLFEMYTKMINKEV